MNIQIRYFTKSRKGNTKKIADALSSNLKIESHFIDAKLDKEVDILFLLNAMYANNIDKNVANFISTNKDKIKLLVNICTSCSGKSTYSRIKKCAIENKVNIATEDKVVIGQWLFFNKNRPNEKDLSLAVDFAKEIINKYSK